MKHLPEEILQQIWEQRAYRKLLFEPIKDRSGAMVYPEVLHPGVRNRDAGPDFFAAKMRIGKLIHTGNVELHYAASEWKLHAHDTDPAYDNVILHVVVEDDMPIIHRTTGKPILTCRMVLPEDCSLFEQNREGVTRLGNLLEDWEKQSETLYRQRLSAQVDSLRERLHSKSINEDEGALIRLMLLRYLGARVNNEAFEQIARVLPLRVVRKHTDHLDQLEALYFGTAGLLNPAPEDEYMKHLQEEWNFLRAKYGLMCICGAVRKFRLRPVAFPHRRLAHMAKLHYEHPSIEQQIAAVQTLDEVQSILAVAPSEYWQYHYDFGKVTDKPLGSISRDTANVIILNVVLPYLTYLSIVNDLGPTRKEAIIAIARSLPPEKNSVVEAARNEGLPIRNALESQALLQKATLKSE